MANREACELPTREQIKEYLAALRGFRGQWATEFGCMESILKGAECFEGSRPAAPMEEGYVYFVEAGGLIKIGWALDPEQRIKSIQHLSPVKLKLLGFTRGSKCKEKSLHYKFAHLRVHGEWFQKSEELLEEVPYGTDRS